MKVLRQNLSRILFCSIGIFYLTLFAGCNTASAASKEDFAGIKSDIIAAYKNYQRVVSLAEYNVYEKTDGDMVKQVMTEVINETPYIFYAGQEYTKEIEPGTSLIKRIVLSYSTEYTNQNGSVNILISVRIETGSVRRGFLLTIRQTARDIRLHMVYSLKRQGLKCVMLYQKKWDICGIL